MNRIVSALALTAVLLLFPLRIGWGCCFGDPEYWLVLFDSEKLLPAHQQPFVFTPHLLHTPQQQIPDYNRMEWEKALGIPITQEDFNQVLYQNAYDAAIWVGNKSVIANSPMATAICAHPEFTNYLRMVRSGEQYQNFLMDPWGNGSVPGCDSALAICLRRMQTTANPFLKQRYAYQALRFSHNIGDFQAVLDLFDRELREDVSPYLHHKALLHVIRAAYHLGQVDRGNYLAALLFETDSDINHLSVYLDLDDERWLQATLKRAPTDPDRAKVFALKAYQCIWHARPWVDSVVRYDPANASLPLLVMREVNKAENWLLGPMVTQQYAALDTTADYSACNPYLLKDDFVRKNYAKDREYIRQFKQWLSAQFPHFPPDTRPVMALALAHLCYLLQEQAAGQTWLARAQHGSRKDPAFLQQAEKEAFLLLTLGDIRQPALQQQLVKLLENQFRQHKALTAGQVVDDGWDVIASKPEWLYFVLKVRFRQLGDITSMAWMDTRAYRFSYQRDSNPHALNRISSTLHEFGTADHALAFLAQVEGKQPLSPLQQHCFTPGMRTHVRAWIDLCGSLLLLENRLPEALAQFERLPDDYYRQEPFKTYLDEDPFTSEMLDRRDLLKEGKRFPRNGKKEVVRRMIALQTEAEQFPEKKAANYLLLGNAWRNMSFLGNAWMMVNPQRYWQDYYSASQPENYVSPAMRYFFRSSRAAACYQQAFEAARATNQPEIAAEAGIYYKSLTTKPTGEYGQWANSQIEGWLYEFRAYKDTKFLRHYRSTCLY